MTAGEVIVLADELRPNAYSREQKLRWLRRLDGQILAELEETHGAACAHPCHCEEGEARRGNPFSSGPETGEADCHTSDVGHWSARTVGEPAALPDSYADDTALLAPFPWGEELYLAWLFCQIDLHNGEIQKYNQSLALLASAWRALADWINRRRTPLGARCWRM